MSATADLRTMLGDEPPARFWRSLAERARTPAFRQALEREFPEIAGRFAVATDRRTALKLLGASLLMAGLGGCKAAEGIAPYVNQPEGLVPGRARYYATTMPLDGFGMGVLAESHEGRPTKIEGNPLHPASLGGTDALTQASVYELYEPSRSRTALKGNEPASWTAFQGEMATLRALMLPLGGAGVGIVIGAETSPTLRRQLGALRQEMPALKLYRHAPLSAAGATPGPRAVYRLEDADVIVSLCGDFLGEGPGKLAYARAFADGRRVRRGNQRMNRLYAFETHPTLTGAKADWRRTLRPSEVPDLARRMLAVGDASSDETIAPLIADLAAAGSRALVIGDAANGTAAAAATLNQRFGGPVHSIASPEIAGDGDLYALADDVLGGRLDTLVVLGVDLVHSGPGDLDIAAALSRLQRLYHLGSHRDGTARFAHWHVPQSHYLEAWSDAAAYDGTLSPIQPLIMPLYDSRTAHEVLAALSGDFVSSGRELVRATWGTLDDASWNAALKAGRFPRTTPALQSAATPETAATVASAASVAIAPAPAVELELVLAADPYLRDGRHAANLQLQELPRPLTKLVWGNAAEIAPVTAARLELTTGDEVALSVGTRVIALPVFVMPAMPEDTVAVSLGFGRAVDDDSDPVGANAFALMQRERSGRVALSRTGRVVGLVTTQDHHAMEGRDIVREVALTAFPQTHEEAPLPTLYPKWDNPQESWGMSIDLNTCIGCMACVSACQVENNTPVVGAEEMARGHDMHWLRVDRYYDGDPANPQTLFQPVPCMHCEDAPCEVVCPINATVHTSDGLNAQVYNRCVGTRYCSQNCPYKVRRFNFFDYNKDLTEDSPLSLLLNPDVTVRERGVMEKCTYCVQRIAEARIGSDITNEPIADGVVLTACQQACPTRAITFGNIKDPAAAVTAEKAEPHSYALLAELGTRPRTTYLAKVSNEPEGSGNG